ncbi:sialidase family protein [Mesorhizobium sp. M0323]|uniref:sialidase family protein n=1 Tax=Mesorhizobium sp. M0323 TaxID=2956938 RepID=UPI003337D1D9
MMRALADDFEIVYRSERPQDVYCYTPGIVVTASRRVVATFDLGGAGVRHLLGPKGSRARGTRFGMAKVYVSDDGGCSWAERNTFPFWHARPFIAGGRLYVLGHAGDLMIMASDDEGETWSAPVALTVNMKWHGSSCNVHYANRHVHLALDERRDLAIDGWNTAGLAPRVLRARIDDDLLNPKSWTISESFAFNETVSPSDFDLFGVPFYDTPIRAPAELGSGRFCAPMGWLEPNIVRFHDPAHLWHDPAGRTLHLFLRANTGGTGYAALVKVIEQDDGRLTTALETVPSGKKALFIPFPGGHLKFFVLYDDETRLYWLLSSQATDSMVRLTHISQARYNLPNNERHRLQLHFSTNCIDWCFAGLVAAGQTERHARNYASMAVDRDDLLVLCRSGDDEGRDPQYTNLITFHRVKEFRNLVY